MAKSILIDAREGTITHVYHNTLEDLYKLLRVTIVEIIHLPKNDVLYFDEEGKFNPHTHGFDITFHRGKRRVPTVVSILGSGLICGTDSEGNDVNANLTLEEVTKMITFFTLSSKGGRV